MVQPVHPRSFDGSVDLDATPVPQPPTSGPPPRARDASEIPDLSHLTRSGSRPGGHSLATAGPLGPAVARGPSPGAVLAIQRRLDAFMAAATPTYHTPEGDAQVATPFRIRGGFPANEGSVVQSSDTRLRDAAKSVGLTTGEVTFIQTGRATPKQVQRLTQGLIDMGHLASGGDGVALDARIRRMMFEHGIGMDCAGYVRQAFIASHPDASSAQWRAPANENLSGLTSRGFVRLRMADAQPGDIIVLKPPTSSDYGHTLIVRDVRTATDGDRARLQGVTDLTSGELAISSSPRLRVFELDSSWGSGGQANAGGVQRMTWCEDQVSGQWMFVVSDDVHGETRSLYNHDVEGVYRLAGRP
jgi:hypothetical protein